MWCFVWFGCWCGFGRNEGGGGRRKKMSEGRTRQSSRSLSSLTHPSHSLFYTSKRDHTPKLNQKQITHTHVHKRMRAPAYTDRVSIHSSGALGRRDSLPLHAHICVRPILFWMRPCPCMFIYFVMNSHSFSIYKPSQKIYIQGLSPFVSHHNTSPGSTTSRQSWSSR